MKKFHVLVVEDDDRIVERVENTLFSLGHSHERVTNQADAQQKLQASDFDYVLLDLHIPARAGRGGASAEFGLHLLRWIRQTKAPVILPVIIMTGESAACVNLMSQLHQLAPSESISKPWPDQGRTLAVVIQSVLDRASPKRDAGNSPEGLKPERAFQGGELVFYSDRAELCGITVVSSSKSCHMWTILNALRHRLDDNRYKALDGNALADLVDSDGGQGSIAGSIRDFRRNVAEQLGRELGLRVGRDDVIETSKAGYRLNRQIVVKDLRNTGLHSATNARANGENERVNTGSDGPVSERRERILALIRSGERLRVPGFAEKLRCSFTTAKREIDALKAQGHIEFAGPAKTGHYRLAEMASV